MQQSRRKPHRSIGTHLYRRLVSPVAFSLYKNAEEAHEAMVPMFKGHYPSRLFANHFDVGKKMLSFNVKGKMQLDGPIGNAAGFDKNAHMLTGLSNIFDYITVGTFLPYAWPGNPKTSAENKDTQRIVRLEAEESMLNCLGFPFEGLDPALKRIEAYKERIPLNASIAVRPPAEGQAMSEALDHFGRMVEQIAQHVPSKIKMIEPNFASPNTKGLTVFFEEGTFDELVGMLTKNQSMQQALLALKMPPHLDEKTRERNLDVAKRWMKLGGDGITMINTVKTPDSRLSMGAGGKSGKAVYETMRANLADYRNELGMKAIINAAGGISPDKVPEVLIEGMADTVQIYTPFVYYGPSYIRDAKVNLLKALDEVGFENMEALRKAHKHA